MAVIWRFRKRVKELSVVVEIHVPVFVLFDKCVNVLPVFIRFSEFTKKLREFITFHSIFPKLGNSPRKANRELSLSLYIHAFLGKIETEFHVKRCFHVSNGRSVAALEPAPDLFRGNALATNAHGSRKVLVSLLHDRSTCVSLSLQPQLNAWGFKLTWPFRNVRFAARLSPCLTLPPRLRALRPLKTPGVVTGMYKRCFMNYSAQFKAVNISISFLSLA